MQFLTEEECRAWAAKRKYLLGERPHSVRAAGPPFSRLNFAIPEDAGRRVALARFVWDAVGSQHAEVLIWVTDWSVWPSSEHMPLADAMRRGLGEDRPIHSAPGCLVRDGENDQALAVLALAVLFLWDCWILTPGGKRAAFFSHDEYGIVFDVEGLSESVCESLDKLRLLMKTETDLSDLS